MKHIEGEIEIETTQSGREGSGLEMFDRGD